MVKASIIPLPRNRLVLEVPSKVAPGVLAAQIPIPEVWLGETYVQVQAAGNEYSADAGAHVL